MARPASRHPTDTELAILKILWEQHPRNVRQVRDALAASRGDVAYTSVMTVMNIMVRKGYLSRRKEGAGYGYSPRVEEKATQAGMLTDLLDRAFNGSAAMLVMNLLEKTDIQADELKELRAMLDKKSGEKKK